MNLPLNSNTEVIFNFNHNSLINNWLVIDDLVMGGVSSSSLKINNDGNGVFEGNISLDNNGGFSSIRHQNQRIAIKKFTKISIRLKGDGKNYQFRIKKNTEDAHSFVAPFTTNGEWQEICFHLKDLYPSFRGRKIDQPNFNARYFEVITFLIGNKKEEHFKLILGNIELK